MPSRPNVHISLSSTDVLIAMLSSDLSGSHGVGGLVRSGLREHIDLAAGSGELPRMSAEHEHEHEYEYEYEPVIATGPARGSRRQ
jgi:hypothetical protein